MNYDAFVNLVQARGRLSSREAAIAAIRATLETLGERLFGGERKDLSAQLPREIADHLFRTNRLEKLSLPDFYSRVAVREPVEYPQAVFHAHVVISVLEAAVSPGEIRDVRAQLPAEFNELFEQRDFISESPMASSPARDQL